MTPEAVKESGLDFHSLRKMFNSMMAGTLSSDIRRGILGWTSENMALEHYFQVLPIHYQKILDAQKVLFDEKSIEWFKITLFLTSRMNTRLQEKEQGGIAYDLPTQFMK